MIYLLSFLTLPPVILALTFEAALRHPHAKLRLLIAAVCDVLANYGGLALLFWDWPNRGEWTFSKRLPRLCELSGWRGALARRCKSFINKKIVGHIP